MFKLGWKLVIVLRFDRVLLRFVAHLAHGNGSQC